MKRKKAKAPGNIFLLGEHSVVYGRKALIASIGKYTETKIEKRKDKKINIKSKGYGEKNLELEKIKKVEYNSPEDYTHELDPLIDLLSIYNEYKNLETGLQIKIDTEIPKESGGMSSSTAVTSSLLRTLNKVTDTEMNAEEYFKTIYPIQVRIHGGAASGSEIISSSLGGYNTVRKKEEKEIGIEYENKDPKPLQIVIGDTQIKSETSETVPYVKKGWEKHPESYNRIFNEIEELVEKGASSVEENKPEELGELMNKNQEKLKTLGVSHPKLERLIQTARENGAYGAKLSGGGKGGIMIALTSNEKQEGIARAIEKEGGKTIITKMGVNGSISR